MGVKRIPATGDEYAQLKVVAQVVPKSDRHEEFEISPLCSLTLQADLVPPEALHRLFELTLIAVRLAGNVELLPLDWHV